MTTFTFRYDSYRMTDIISDIMNIVKATLEDGFSLRDLYADVRFRLTQCDFLPGNKLRLHAGFLSKYQTMRGKASTYIFS